MKFKTFIILLVICGILGAGAYMVLNPSKASNNQNKTGTKLLADLMVNNISSIIIESTDDKVMLEKGSVWEVTNKYSYPADFGKIIEFAKKLKDMKIGRSFNASDETRSRLALYSADTKDIAQESKGIRITCKDKDKKILADIILGKAREASSGYGGHYVMPVNDKNIYLVDKDFKYIDKTSSDWLDKDLMNIASNDVKQVVCKDSQNNIIYTIKRPEKGKAPEFIDVPQDKKIITSKLNDVFNALSSMRLDDIADPQTPDSETSLDKALSFEYALFDGTVYTVYYGNPLKDDQNKYFFKANVKFTAPEKSEEVKTKENTDQSKQNIKSEDGAKTKAQKTEDKKQEDTKDPAVLAADADKLNKKLSPWTFIIPKWKAERLIKDVEEFFEKPEPENKETAPGTAQAD